jgi:hypothetical protein
MTVTVLGLAGSARKQGNTETLLDWCLEGARDEGAEIVKFRLCDLDLRGCRGCEACSKDGHCIQRDEMHRLYPHLRNADSIVLAAPVYSMGLPGVPKIVVDRCQPFWALKYVLRKPLTRSEGPERLGAFLSCGGTDFADTFQGSRRTVDYLWRVLGVTNVGALLYPKVDAKGEILQRAEARPAAEEMGRRLGRDR